MKYKLFIKDDISGFWALFADNLANIIIISSVCAFVFKIPNEIIFGHIVPGIGIMLIFGLFVYAFMAVMLAKKENRDDITSLPFGISTPILFVYLFGVIGPVYWVTNDSLLAWKVGMAAGFIGGIIEASGSLIGPFLKRTIPRAGMLGTIAGIAIVWIANVPLSEIFEHPIIGFPALAIIFIGLVGKIKLPGNIPAGLAAIITGTCIALFLGDSKISFEGVGVYIPVPLFGDLLSGLSALFERPELLMIIIPTGIYNFIETMNNVESAEAAGDKYNVSTCQLFDGIATIVGSIFGNPFPTTVYIGHPAYKRLGAKAGYTLGVGIVFFLGSIFGFISFLHNLIPTAAVAPMLVFVGLVITSQAFSATPAKHGMAVAVAFIPHISNLISSQLNGLLNSVNNVFTTANAAFTPQLIENMLNTQGIHYLGQNALAQGSIVIGLLWGAIVANVIDKNLMKAGYFTLAAGILTVFGIIHNKSLGIFLDSNLFYGYLLIALVFFITNFFSHRSKENEETEVI